ncbi:MAG: type IV secretion system DNA-binding domain-containing protein [Actinomycetota bacterium]|nr:type IV secretion system DNA-binding domain-containing protein [Actinomycetota bacterium]
MTEPPHRGRYPPYLVLAAFVVLLLSPGVVAAAALVAAAIGTEIFRRARAHSTRPVPAPEAGSATLLGTTEGGRPFHLTDLQLSAHTLILGASGAGKSNTLLTIVGEHVARGRGAVVIDMKGSQAFAGQLEAAARRAGRPFRLWTLDGPGHWNPLAHGNPSELKDRLISAERWTEPHYQRAAERYVQTVLQVWADARPARAPTLTDVVGLMDQRRLAVMLRDVPRERANHVLNYVASLTPDQLSAVRGLETRLAIIAESHAGTYLDPAGPGTIDLQAAMREGEVVLFSLNSSRYGQLAAQVGALVAQDLNAAMGSRLEHGGAVEPFMIGVDELSALGAEHVLNLVARGREASFPVVSATQELADIQRVARGLADQLLGIPGIKIAHRQDLPESARMIAEVAGTERVWEHTYHTDRRALLPDRDTGRGTRREVERYRVEPDTIKTLAPGEAVVVTKIPTSSVQRVTVRPPRPRDELERE